MKKPKKWTPITPEAEKGFAARMLESARVKDKGEALLKLDIYDFVANQESVVKVLAAAIRRLPTTQDWREITTLIAAAREVVDELHGYDAVGLPLRHLEEALKAWEEK